MSINTNESRHKMSLEEARKVAMKTAICHVVENSDNTYSVVGHINCEYCDFCEEASAIWQANKAKGMSFEELRKKDLELVHGFKEDIYSEQKIKHPENYYVFDVRFSDEDKVFIGNCPSLNGCSAHGDTYEKCYDNLLSVAKEWLKGAKELGLSIPK